MSIKRKANTIFFIRIPPFCLYQFTDHSGKDLSLGEGDLFVTNQLRALMPLACKHETVAALCALDRLVFKGEIAYSEFVKALKAQAIKFPYREDYSNCNRNFLLPRFSIV